LFNRFNSSSSVFVFLSIQGKNLSVETRVCLTHQFESHPPHSNDTETAL
jgi:hypothetical protein